MKSRLVPMSRGGWIVTALFLGALWVVAPSFSRCAAQEPGPSAKKLSGRLPPYYGQVVSKDQREKIYTIQAKFGEQLMKLREQIGALEKQLQQEVDGVLTPEQRDQVAKRMADARAKRAASAPSGPRGSTSGPPASTAESAGSSEGGRN